MAKIEFAARETANGREFICTRCSGEVVKLAEKQYARQRPYVMECKRCGLVSGSWDTDDERNQFHAGLELEGPSAIPRRLAHQPGVTSL